jgi:hypothetical protein
MNENSKWFRKEIHFIAWIILTLLAIITPLFTYLRTQDNIAFRVKAIEEARAEVWNYQRNFNNEQIKMNAEIRECLVLVKDKLQLK